MREIDANLVPPLDIWAGKGYLLDIWNKIRQEFLRLIEKWETFKEKRSRIEVLFDIVKNTLGLKRLHQYTGRSVEKRVFCTFHLAFYLIQLAEGMGISARELVYWWVEEGVKLHNLESYIRLEPPVRKWIALR
ncbi:MAG: hypothetical protein J7J01_08575 [Methanophagales archaeon]|nr:hypothetical protein [Methanophagales archaeon]